MKRNSFLHKAGIISEYMIIFSIIGAALISMSVYLQRSFQGRTKDLTDHIIFDKHLSQVSDLESAANRQTESSVIKYHDIGGQTAMLVEQNLNINRTTRYFDPDKELEDTLFPGERAEGAVTETTSRRDIQLPGENL